ncbi:unnamed protein product [Phaeothamnion confervicola]
MLLSSLPIAPFMPCTDDARHAKRQKRAASPAAQQPPPLPPAPELVWPHKNAEKWAPLVERTRAHTTFATAFGFPNDGSWVEARACGSHCAGLPQVLALDCEMCMSEDPVSRERNHKELVRVSVVDGRSGATVLDSLVRPTLPVLDYRSSIHGVKAAHLANVAFTTTHAQAAMAALCCRCTVLVGHALHNDLEALKFRHAVCVDTAMLYELQDEPGATPGLRDLAKACLGKDIQDGAHDSVADAVAALEVAKHALKHGPVAPVARSREGGKHAELFKTLLVHRVPQGVSSAHLAAMFFKLTNVVATAVSEVEMGPQHAAPGVGRHMAPTGKAVATFRTRRHCDLAFEMLAGEATLDKSGRLQKRVYLPNRDYVQVRKMHNQLPKDSSRKGKESGRAPGAAAAAEA